MFPLGCYLTYEPPPSPSFLPVLNLGLYIHFVCLKGLSRKFEDIITRKKKNVDEESKKKGKRDIGHTTIESKRERKQI